MAECLNNIAGYMVEAGLHGAECFSSILRKIEDETAQVQIYISIPMTPVGRFGGKWA